MKTFFSKRVVALVARAQKPFNRLRDDAWSKIEARRQLELDKNTIQEQMMEAAKKVATAVCDRMGS